MGSTKCILPYWYYSNILTKSREAVYKEIHLNLVDQLQKVDLCECVSLKKNTTIMN